MRRGESQSFWTTIPGVLTGLAALVTALGGTWAAFRPTTKERCDRGVDIESAVNLPVAEHGVLLICDGENQFSLDFVAVSAARKQVEMRVATAGRSPRPITLEFQSPKAIFEGPARYEAEVTDIANWVQGNDTALLSVRKQ